MKIVLVWMIFLGSSDYKGTAWNSPPMPTQAECERVQKLLPGYMGTHTRCIQFQMMVKE